MNIIIIVLDLYGVPFVSKLYTDLECNILIAGIYKCPGTL